MHWRLNIRDLIIYFGLLVGFHQSLLFGEEFPFVPPENFKVKPEYIVVHHPVSSSQLLAQLYFDQGFTFLYAFNHDAAYWSFLRASEVDPKMAMAYWGMALALGSNINMEVTPQRGEKAYQLIQRAIDLSKEGKKVEQDYIHALSYRYSSNSKADPKQLALDYSQAMKELSQKYPDDLDAPVLYAESLLDVNPWNQWSVDGKPNQGTMEAVKALESVLKRDPNHLGANHYFIHAVEASKHPEIALTSADRLSQLMPSSGHILHMPSHIYLLVGDYLRAARANEAAVAVDREYIKEYGMRGIYPLHYLSHNLFFLSRSNIMLGRYEGAKQAADELVQLYVPHLSSMPDLEYYATAPMIVLLTFNRWQDILSLPEPGSDLKMTTVLWHFARGIAFASLGNIHQAEQELHAFLDSKKNLSPSQQFGYNKASEILKIAELSLNAKIAYARQEIAKAINFFEQAIAEQDLLHYNEPPDWFFPVRENLGSLLLSHNRHEEAEAVFREDLKRHPRNGRSLFGLQESLRAQSKTHDLYWVNQEFQRAWMYSDINLTIQEL